MEEPQEPAENTQSFPGTWPVLTNPPGELLVLQESQSTGRALFVPLLGPLCSYAEKSLAQEEVWELVLTTHWCGLGCRRGRAWVLRAAQQPWS